MSSISTAMCQLFGLNSAKPVSPHFSLRGFFRRGGGTDHHGDGWGLAYFKNHNTILQVRDTPAHVCRDADAVVRGRFKASTAIAHVRKATQGMVRPENSHPFARRLWGRDWVFAHNGNLENFYPDLDGRFLPVGDTDSERAFCYILSRLYDQFGLTDPGADRLLDVLTKLSTEIAAKGAFNYLLSDGRALYAHASTQLFWTERFAPFGRAELVDDKEQALDFGDHNDPDDRIIVVATEPLTRGEAWYAMGRGELRVFIGGRNYASFLRCGKALSGGTAAARNAPQLWCTGWDITLTAWL